MQLYYLLFPPIVYTTIGLFTNLLDFAALICLAIIAFLGIKQKVADAWFSIISIIIAMITYVLDGISPSKDGGRIIIYIKKERAYTVFSVKDTGVGMSNEKITEIFKENYKVKESVGIANINNRLKYLYGLPLSIISKPGAGTEVTWMIPLRRIHLFNRIHLNIFKHKFHYLQ